MRRLVCLLLLCVALAMRASAQELDLPQAALKDDAPLASAMPALAKQAIAIYQEPDRDRYLSGMFRLQMVAGQYLTDNKSGDNYHLSTTKPSKTGFLAQEVDFADRKTTNNDYYPSPIVGKKPDLSNGHVFISEPFTEPVEISGLFSGEIKATINKKDVDIGVVLYELMPNGELFHLSYFVGRASYARDMSVRRLLTPGEIAVIPFDRTRLVSRRLSKGSRLMVTLNVNKHPFAQINYGTGKDVSDEDINDAKTPLQIKWHNDSFIKIPIWKR